jgi:hypothetical protein
MCLLLFSSCLTVKKIERNCDKFAKVCVTETTTQTLWRDTTIYVDKAFYIDTTIFVPIPGFKDSVRIRDSVVVRDNYAYMKSIHVEKGIIAVDASVNRSVFSVDAYLTDSTILYHFQDTLNYQDSLTIYNAIRERTTTSTVVLPPVKYIPKLYKITFWIVILQVLVCIVLLLSEFGVFRKLLNLFR